MPHPEIIAHRGASRDQLENTLSAFSLALEQQADAFELDVHATRDGVVVVHHDPDVHLTASPGDVASDGRLTISAVDYTTLRSVSLRNGEPIPTLDDVLDLAAGKATVYVEVKGFGIEAQVISCLARHANTRAAVHSFDHRIPHRISTAAPAIPAGILSASYPLDVRHMLEDVGARDFWQQTALIDAELVATVHAAGARVVAWTENNVAHAAELVQMGVDAICTDTPGLMRAGLRAQGLL